MKSIKSVSANYFSVSVSGVRLGQQYAKVKETLSRVIADASLDEMSFGEGLKVLSYTSSDEFGFYGVFFSFDKNDCLQSILIRTTQVSEIIRLFDSLHIKSSDIVENQAQFRRLSYGLHVKSNNEHKADYIFEISVKSPRKSTKNHKIDLFEWKVELGVLLLLYVAGMLLYVVVTSDDEANKRLVERSSQTSRDTTIATVAEKENIADDTTIIADDYASVQPAEVTNRQNAHLIQRQEYEEEDFSDIFGPLDAVLSGTPEKKNKNIRQQPRQTEVPYTVTPLYAGKMPFKDYFGEGIWDETSESYLKVINESNTDAVVLLQDRNGRVIRHNVVLKHTSYTIRKIPECDCILKVMYGNKWNSDRNNGVNHPKGGFMEDVAYSASEWSNSFDFHKEYENDCIYFPQYSVTLHKVENGNFHTHTISGNGFFDK